ncbi:hypothetical protein OJAV_G00102780 [Oryzias javanicus]|uniref:Uncharacterized protein n=1 Tax=Oryzias javanicus TaxID=123683 RepID=A0A437CXR2_ORYJA|nr:hypothetical protein OJAV_G00102780 [Oryzias javanicus]
MLMYALGICISSGMTFSEAGLHGACSLGAALGVPAGVGTHLIISAARCLPTFGILQPRVPTTNHLWISPLSCFTATDSALPAHGVLQLQKDKGTPLTSPSLEHHQQTLVQHLLSLFSISLHRLCLSGF